jgi:hypothetical protein
MIYAFVLLRSIPVYPFEPVFIGPDTTVVVIAESLPFTPRENSEYSIHDFDLVNDANCKEVRLVCNLTSVGSLKNIEDFNLLVYISETKNATPYFSIGEKYNILEGAGFTAPLLARNLKCSIRGRGGGDRVLKIAILASFRRGTIYTEELEDSTLREFDRRYRFLQDNIDGIRQAYEIPKIVWEEMSAKVSLLGLDYLNELGDMFDPGCIITIVYSDEIERQSVGDFVKSIGRSHFSFLTKLENLQ